MTLVSQLVTSPLSCATFGTLSVVAPLANVLLGPLFSVLLVLGLLSALFVWLAPVQAALLLGCDAVGGALMVVLRALADLPGACVAVSVQEGPALLALAASVAALLATWPRVRRRALASAVGALTVLALAWHVRWRYFAPACVRVLDVGQGDAILVTDGPFSALVDTGPGEAVVGALARSNVSHLDAVVLTHLHSDHAGGLEDLLAVIDVDLLVVPEATDAAELPEGVSVDEVGHGDVLRVGNFSMRVVSPLEPAGGEGNEGSLELALTYERDGRALTALLAADAEREETGAAVERGDVGDVDLLKVGHHGSETSVTPEIAAALAPEVSVASAGEGNGYGHPDPVCVGMLEDAGSLFLCTMDVGGRLRGAGRDGAEGELPAVGSRSGDARMMCRTYVRPSARPSRRREPHGRETRPAAGLPHRRSGRAQAQAGGRTPARTCGRSVCDVQSGGDRRVRRPGARGAALLAQHAPHGRRPARRRGRGGRQAAQGRLRGRHRLPGESQRELHACARCRQPRQVHATLQGRRQGGAALRHRVRGGQKGRDLPPYVQKLAASHGVSIGADAARELVARVGESTTMLDTQLATLAALLGGSGTITQEFVEANVARRRRGEALGVPSTGSPPATPIGPSRSIG